MSKATPFYYNYKLIIAYRGTHYKGWQKTSLGPSIESTLEQSVFRILGATYSLQAASRTDAGVHANGQVINLLIPAPIPVLQRFQRSLNGTLPPDIRVLAIECAPPTFHPTLDATGKLYTYSICHQPVQLPFHRDLSWHFPYPLDIPLMRQEARSLLGTHDFSAFCNERTLWTRNPICTLHSIEIIPSDDRLILSFHGDHFLYKMVRNLAGTLAYIGCGKIPPHTLPNILSRKMRTYAGVTAPAHGLTLTHVFYEPIQVDGDSSID